MERRDETFQRSNLRLLAMSKSGRFGCCALHALLQFVGTRLPCDGKTSVRALSECDAALFVFITRNRSSIEELGCSSSRLYRDQTGDSHGHS
jgi:hypothetical protein